MQPLSLQGVLAAGLSLVSSAGTGGVPDSCLPLEHEITWWDNVEIKWGKLRLLRWLGLRYSTEISRYISALQARWRVFFCPLGYFVLLQPAEFTFTASQFLLLTLHHGPSCGCWNPTPVHLVISMHFCVPPGETASSMGVKGSTASLPFSFLSTYSVSLVL